MRVFRYAAAACLLFAQHASPVAAVPTAQEHNEDPGKLDDDRPKGPAVDPAKYFHEPGGDDVLGHYDVRYFDGVVSDEERKTTIRHMTRAYLTWFRKQGLETWIAHGTLLGWWWSGRMLPWDWDVDTQVADRTLAYLRLNHNRTRVHYKAADGSDVERTYLLDVNPYSEERVRGNGMNIIDARWIDTSNGLYIDITGLSETEPDENPGVWACKNNHRYYTGDLYPMRESTYEGVPALIPYAYDKILIQEYQEKALTATEYEGHHFSSEQRLWLKEPEDPEKPTS
ncbi:mannosylphosphate transferase [Diplodia corticola]|uniref:Mannosylphosphate transferase n=1 Tax=Diplodia corticola TaxID=236234 RepID=A0A1J9RKG8_9PEZI|nr:mannosylphosphate transferase [Diplodia corticola]OJD29015.1 mannosylphosphate transferase [Diplodia corticola]